MPDWRALVSALEEHGIRSADAQSVRAVSGGDISAAWRIAAHGGPVFLKTGGAETCDMFAAEACGLRELARADAVRVPAVLGFGISGKDSFLALEWVDFDAASPECGRVFGRQLASQHRVVADRFGWERNNTIGRTLQLNTWDESWVYFYREHRLNFQLGLAAKNGYAHELEEAGARLAENLGAFFSGYEPQPSLLHGDLWGGNWASAGGQPIIFDPAVYYGDRESDIAMTRLFGGFPGDFYRSYDETWPLAEGHESRLTIYLLYHVLNHLNLFGRSYLGRARSLIDEALAAIN